MKTKHMNEAASMQRKVLCIAVAAAFAGPVLADEDDDVARLVKPESNVSLGVGHVSDDNQRFGIYNGLNKEGSFGLVDFSVVRREDETGTWFRAKGRNLGLDTRELRIEYERQGDWKYSVDFSQTPRVSPYEIHTGLRGIGTNNQSYTAYNPPLSTAPAATNPTRPASTAPGISLKTERETTKLGFNKVFTPELEFRVVFQNEEKEGSRLFGRGTGGLSAPLPLYVSVQEFLAEPIKSTARQLDVILDYTGEKLQLSGGYYGSLYDNHNPVLDVSGGAYNFNTGAGAAGVPFNRISLPPDNSSHQLHLAGGYQFTNTTRGSFKVAKTIGLQNDNFMAVRYNNGGNANVSGRSDLGGRLDTTLVQFGLTSRPLPKLSLLANVRYEDRDDKTPVVQYITAGLNGTSSTDGYNEPRSLTNKSAKFEANYQLPEGFRVVGGLDVEQKERSMAGVRVVGYREHTDEVTWRLEAKRAMADALTGSLAYLHSERTGSSYRNLVTRNGTTPYPNYAAGLTPATVSRYGLLQPIYIADRERDKVRLTFDWAPLDTLSAQFIVEESMDDYGRGRGNPDIGARKGNAHNYTVDISYALTDNWKLTSWASRNETQIDQATLANMGSNATVTLWSSSQRNVVDSFALGARGKLLSAKLDVGAEYIWAHDSSSYRLNRENQPTTPAAVADLPDITWKQSTLKVFGKYAVSKDTAVRLDYIFDHRKTNDWTWNSWTYSDGTTVTQRPDEKVHFIGVSMNYAFR